MTNLELNMNVRNALSASDINTPSLKGGTAYDGLTGKWSVTGAGSDIWNSSDQFQFASQAFTGDTTLSVKVDSQANTNAWAKAGLMLRNDETAGSAFASILATPSNGVSFQKIRFFADQPGQSPA